MAQKMKLWNPFMELARFENDLHQSFRSVRDRVYAPLLDLEESDNAFKVSVNLPGFKKDDIKLDASFDFLEITASKEEVKTETDSESEVKEVESEWKPVHIERMAKKYHRKITFKIPIDVEKAKTSFESGVLTIDLPKSPEAQKRQLTIN